MHRPLLHTRLVIPPAPRRSVPRDRLLDLLERGVPEHGLTLISAPAGYGKTTLACQWARRTRLPVAWLTVDRTDQSLETFLRYLFAAWVTIEPSLERAAPGVLLGGARPDTDAVLEGLVNAAAEAGGEVAIVIDDCDATASPEIWRAVAFLVDSLPPSVHLVLTCRGEPDLPLARYRARQVVLEIGERELRLTDDECSAMLTETMGLDLAADGASARLNQRLEGWAAGLQLAALALRSGTGEVPDLAVSGRQRFIADFLRDEVLGALPDATRRFLLATSVVDRLCGSLCDALTGGSDGQATLEWLERRHLFTQPLDADREWYRYHGLVRDVLREQLDRDAPDDVAALHGRAARWYLDRDLPEAAFDHALAANQVSLGYEVLDHWGMVAIFTGKFHTVEAWLRAVPEPWYAQHPDLVLLRVALLLFTGQFERAFGILDELEQTIAASEPPPALAVARVTAVRCFIACERNDVEQAERLAQAALGLLPDADSTFRAGVRGALGDVYRRNGRWEESRHNYLIALTHTSTYENYVQSIHAYGALADLGFRRGRLREAAAYWRKALEVIDDEELWGAYPLPVLGWVHIRLGEILYEWNELDAVRGHLELGQAQARLGGDPRSIIAGALLEARLRVAEGESGRAAVALDQARSAIGDAEYPEWRSAFDLCQVALWLAAGHPGTAVSWATDAAVDVEAPPDSEPSRLALARALLAAGDPASIQRARSVLEPLLAAADAEGRLGIVVETLALLAATRWAANDQPGALEAIERALRLAEPEGYVRSFVDLGPPVIRVLQAARDRGVMPETVTGLLNAASAGGGEPGRVALPEPLSEREKEVLSRLAAGLTNREIGDALFISPETVKKHTGSIYGKLGARNRTEAVRVARDLGLLD